MLKGSSRKVLEIRGSRRMVLEWGLMLLVTVTSTVGADGEGSWTRLGSTVKLVKGLMWVLLLPLPLTLSAAVLDTVPYLLLAVQVNIPESSGKTSAMTRVHISSDSAGDLGFFCRILNSGESSMTFPSLYQSTRGEGTPFIRHSSTTSWPSDAWRSCRLFVNTGAAMIGCPFNPCR